MSSCATSIPVSVKPISYVLSEIANFQLKLSMLETSKLALLHFHKNFILWAYWGILLVI